MVNSNCRTVTESLAKLSDQQLATLVRAGLPNDERKLPELAAVSKYLRYAARWELERRDGILRDLVPPSDMIAPSAIQEGIQAMRTCGLVAMAHDLEMAKGMEAARFYLAVAGGLATQ